MNRPGKATLINGVAADYLSINDRAIHYGDGLFETILCDNNKLLYWSQHYQRLQSSAIRLKMNCPDEKLLLADIKALLAEVSNIENKSFVVKIILSRGSGERGYQFSKGNSETRVVTLSALATDYSSLLSGELLSGDLYLCKQQASINESLAGLKHLNRLENVMARNEWKNVSAKNKIIDGLMLNATAHVVEGTMSNLFAVKDGALLTPNLKYSGINGIMRDRIIDVAEQQKMDVVIADITLEDLYVMDELFISNSLIGIKAVINFVEHRYQLHDVANKLLDALIKKKEEHVQIIH